MNPQLEKDLKNTMDIISSNWKMQSNSFDRSTNFIYRMNSLNDCMIEIDKTHVDRDYALHRWYNYMTSIYYEYIFEIMVQFTKMINITTMWIFILMKFPFDVKLSVYTAKLSSRPYDLTTRSKKDGITQINHNKTENKCLTDYMLFVMHHLLMKI